MKKFTREYPIREYRSPVFDLYFGGLTPCVFDIETTGLSAENGSKVILTAMLTPYREGVRITQFLAEDPYEEDRVLQATVEFLAEEKIDYLITYNGSSFDIPFVKRRLARLNLPYDPDLYELDLFRFFRKNTLLPDQLDSLRQKSVETHFGLHGDRRDVISGRESVKLYQQYALTGDPVLEKIVLTHNREDVLQLLKVMKAAGAEDFGRVLKDVDVDGAFARTGLPSGRGALTARPKIAAGCLTVSGRQLRLPYCETPPRSAVLFPDLSTDLSAEFNSRTSSYEICVPLEKRDRSLYLDVRPLLPRTEADAFLRRLTGQLQAAPGYINDYLLLVEDGIRRQREINLFSILISTLIHDEVR